MLVIAAIGLAVNLVVALVLGSHKHEHDLNVHSAFLHVVGDAVSSVGVILAAILIALTGWGWVDPLASILIGVLIAASAYRVTRSSLHILIEGVPEGLSTLTVSSAMAQVAGVADVHDLHVWNICSGHIALSAHVVPTGSQVESGVMQSLKTLLRSQFDIEHTTIQLEQLPCGQQEDGCGGSTKRTW
jgi:cobalt-zinc-cadmium efflux system protein